MSAPKLEPLLWMDAEPEVLARDKADIAAFATDLIYVEPGVDDEGAVVHHGLWVGTIPVWPFERPAPEGLAALVATGAELVMTYPAAYPMLPPSIRVINPEPLMQERGFHTWHVAPGGNLCLLQTENDWTPTTSPTELLLKAAGWRIEYALMKAGVVDKMTTNGIVIDDSRDHLIANAVTKP